GLGCLWSQPALPHDVPARAPRCPPSVGTGGPLALHRPCRAAPPPPCPTCHQRTHNCFTPCSPTQAAKATDSTRSSCSRSRHASKVSWALAVILTRKVSSSFVSTPAIGSRRPTCQRRPST